MRQDAVTLERFYASALGRAAARVLAGKLTDLWGDASGLSMLGLGYALPVLEANFTSALVLDELFSEAPFSAAPPELFVLFSSVSALLGLPGQVEYTAATIALDRLAHARSRRVQGRTLSINWSAWRDVGVLADLVRAQRLVDHRSDMTWHGAARSRPPAAASPAANPRRHAESPADAALRLGITTAEGVEALDRVLATDLDGQIIAYFSEKGFGFIEDAEHQKFFFHIANVVDDALRQALPNYNQGDIIGVRFCYGGSDGKKYPKAVEVSAAPGALSARAHGEDD